MSAQPFNHNYFIGYVNQVYPDFVRVHFPSSVLLNKFIYSGEEFNGGLVGNYVTIEGDNVGFIGKIIELSLPEKERLELNEKAFRNREFHPTGKIEILLCFDYFQPENVSKGLTSYPNIGSKVFVCPSTFIQSYFRNFGVKTDDIDLAPTFDLGTLTSSEKTKIEVSQQALFGRHCAIVGTTGGGKSWTVSKCLEEIIKNNGKAILLDATGEYSSFENKHGVEKSAVLGDDSFFHFSNLTVEDIFVLLRPGGQVQSPKLMEAIKSLKIVNVLNKNSTEPYLKKNGEDFSVLVESTPKQIWEDIIIKNGILKKINARHRPYNQIYYKFIEEIESLHADFDILKLPLQISNECVWDNRADSWGGQQETHLSNCVSLILRANNLLQNPVFSNIFGFKKNKSEANELTTVINKFLKDDTKNILRIGFEKVGFEFKIREILGNAIGKYLLKLAREKGFKDAPIILFIDEAHQYMNKYVKDEYFELSNLDAFDLIAKECRKYGLFLCLATQMPRDIPTGTLSQMGTFIVHRIINPYDKEAVEHSCSTANKNSLSFLPILGEGEAILTGVDFPMPVILKINKPMIEPDSKTPKFKNLNRPT